MTIGVHPWANTAQTVVSLGIKQVTLLHPKNAFDLISNEEFDMDERLPYWADIWPASRALARTILEEPNAHGKTLLELGCGLGLVSIAAMQSRFRVLATDYYEAALEFARHNAKLNGLGDLTTMPLNWRMERERLRRFDYVVASDVLYEREYGNLVADTIDRYLNDEGTALIADPGRIGSRDFLDRCEEIGFTLTAHRRLREPGDGGREVMVNVYRFRRASRTAAVSAGTISKTSPTIP